MEVKNGLVSLGEMSGVKTVVPGRASVDVVEVTRLVSSVNQSISEVVALESETQQLGINELILPQVVSVNELAIRDGYVERMSVLS